MPLYFDARRLGDPSREYVAWIDVMGMQGALRRSISVAANFVYKLHDAALKSVEPGVRLYPVMDGVYACAADEGTMTRFLRSVLRLTAEEFVSQERNHFRFVVRGGLACGEVYHGAALDPEASWSLRDNPVYRDHVLLGAAMVAAHVGEAQAPPFGLFLDDTAAGFIDETAPFPFDRWWRWHQPSDHELLPRLREALSHYYEWCTTESSTLGYAKERIRVHRGHAALYLRDG